MSEMPQLEMPKFNSELEVVAENDVAAGRSKREQPLVSSWSGVGEAPRR